MTIMEESIKAEYLDMEGLQLYDSLIKAKIGTDIKANEYDDSGLITRIITTENAITTLNGDGEGSVRKQVNDVVAKIIVDAPEAYDTLKEISDWIYSHADSASAMNSQINTNKTEIATLQSKVESLESVTYIPITEEQINSLFSD